MDIQQYIIQNKLRILVKPNAKKTEILGYDHEKNIVKIALAAPPEENKANKELLKFVSRILKKKVHFVTGLRSKEKVLEISH